MEERRGQGRYEAQGTGTVVERWRVRENWTSEKNLRIEEVLKMATGRNTVEAHYGFTIEIQGCHKDIKVREQSNVENPTSFFGTAMIEGVGTVQVHDEIGD